MQKHVCCCYVVYIIKTRMLLLRCVYNETRMLLLRCVYNQNIEKIYFLMEVHKKFQLGFPVAQ